MCTYVPKEVGDCLPEVSFILHTEVSKMQAPASALLCSTVPCSFRAPYKHHPPRGRAGAQGAQRAHRKALQAEDRSCVSWSLLEGRAPAQQQTMRSSFSKALASSWLSRFPFKLERTNKRHEAAAQLTSLWPVPCLAKGMEQSWQLGELPRGTGLGTSHGAATPRLLPWEQNLKPQLNFSELSAGHSAACLSASSTQLAEGLVVEWG